MLFWSRGAETIYGWSAAEVLHRSVQELLYDQPSDFLKAEAMVLSAGEWSGELRQRKKNGAGYYHNKYRY